MRLRLIPIAFLAVLCLSSLRLFAQTDTTHYDLGRLQLKKDFTQSITIKAADLEKIPAGDLADAINTWLYGTYTNGSLTYIIDGNLLNDVNAYSIYDIDEITLIQNASAQIAGAGPQQYLVLIKTKHNRPGKSGLIAAGQSNTVSLKSADPGYKGTTSLYNQYYLSAYKNTADVHAGVSADYLRDVTPGAETATPSSINTNKPYNYNRFKFNGYAVVKLSNSTTINAAVSYVPQVTGFNNSAYSFNNSGQNSLIDSAHIKQHLFNASLQFNTQISQGLSNTLSIGYNHYNYSESELGREHETDEAGGYNSFDEISNTDTRSTVLIRENLAYHKTIRDFTMEPNLNFNYQLERNTPNTYANYFTGSRDTSLTGNTNSTTEKVLNYFLTPSIGLYFKNSISVQGGVLFNLNSKQYLGASDNGKKRLFPYASTSIDVSNLTGLQAVGIKLYGSVAKQNQILQTDNITLAGLSINNPNLSIIGKNQYPAINYAYPSSYDSYTPSTNYQAGATIELPGLITLSYDFEKHNYQLSFLTGVPTEPGVGYENVIADVKSTTNRIGVLFTLVNKSSLRFKSGINATKEKVIYNADIISTDQNTLWSGGWVNRLEYKNVSAGLDVLYQKVSTPISSEKTNPFSLQNLYVGYNIQVKGLKDLKVFANGRNIWQSKNPSFTDNRKFYGLGFKLGL